MGCLMLLILVFLFRGFVFGLLAWLISLLIAFISFLLRLGFWGILTVLGICAIAAVMG